VLLGDGEGGFAVTAAYTTGSGPRCVAAGDVDGDARTDLVTADTSSSGVSVLLGDGEAGFAT
jgi:hypothetical protein